MYQLSAPRTTGCGTGKILAGLGLFATTDMANRYRLPLVSTRIKQYVNLCSHVLKQHYDTIKNHIRLQAYVLVFHLLLKADGIHQS